MKALLRTNDSWAATIVRLTLAVIFIAHGSQKMLGLFGGYGWSGTIHFFGQLGIPAPLGALAIIAEFFGGLGLLVGLLTRVAAAGIAVDMLVAIFKVHLPNGFFIGPKIGFEFAFACFGMALATVVSGAGMLSLDRALHKALYERSSAPLTVVDEKQTAKASS